VRTISRIPDPACTSPDRDVLRVQAIMHFLVNTVTRGLQQHLIRDLYREEHFDQLVREREDVAARRQECTAGLAALREALTALERLPANLMSRVRDVPAGLRSTGLPGGAFGFCWTFAHVEKTSQNMVVTPHSGMGGRQTDIMQSMTGHVHAHRLAQLQRSAARRQSRQPAGTWADRSGRTRRSSCGPAAAPERGYRRQPAWRRRPSPMPAYRTSCNICMRCKLYWGFVCISLAFKGPHRQSSSPTLLVSLEQPGCRGAGKFLQ